MHACTRTHAQTHLYCRPQTYLHEHGPAHVHSYIRTHTGAHVVELGPALAQTDRNLACSGPGVRPDLDNIGHTIGRTHRPSTCQNSRPDFDQLRPECDEHRPGWRFRTTWHGGGQNYTDAMHLETLWTLLFSSFPTLYVLSFPSLTQRQIAKLETQNKKQRQLQTISRGPGNVKNTLAGNGAQKRWPRTWTSKRNVSWNRKQNVGCPTWTSLGHMT